MHSLHSKKVPGPTNTPHLTPPPTHTTNTPCVKVSRSVKTLMQPEQPSNLGLLKDMSWSFRCCRSHYHPVRLQGCGFLPLCVKGHAGETSCLCMAAQPKWKKQLFSLGLNCSINEKKIQLDSIAWKFNAYSYHILKKKKRLFTVTVRFAYRLNKVDWLHFNLTCCLSLKKKIHGIVLCSNSYARTRQNNLCMLGNRRCRNIIIHIPCSCTVGKNINISQKYPTLWVSHPQQCTVNGESLPMLTFNMKLTYTLLLLLHSINVLKQQNTLVQLLLYCTH